MIGVDDLRRADQQLAVVMRANQFLQASLDAPTEVLRVARVDAAVHETEAIGRADDGVASQVQDRAPMHLYVRHCAAVLLPSVGRGGSTAERIIFTGRTLATLIAIELG